MTDLAPPAVITPVTTRQPWWVVLPGAFFGGIALGVIARGWMRIIAKEPDFTLGGSIFIVMAFTIFSTIQAGVYLARRRFPRRRWVRRVARVAGTIGTLPLFVGAGGIMMPTVLAGGAVHAHRRWSSTARILGTLIALVPVGFVTWTIVNDFGFFSWHTPVGIALFVAIYALVVRLTRPSFSPPPEEGWPMWAVVPLLGIVAAVMALLSVGLEA